MRVLRFGYWPLLAMLILGVGTENVRADLVGLWRFDSDVAPQPDASGNGGDGELQGDVRWVNDPVRGGVMEFDGEQDYLEVQDSDPLSIEGAITIAAWAHFATFDTWNGIVAKTGVNSINKPSPYDVYTMQSGEGWVSFYTGSGDGAIAQIRSELTPELEEWQHIAVTMNEDGEVTHYLNGELNGEGFVDLVGTPPIDEDTNVYIGSRQDFVTNMNGFLDDVAIFNEALSAEQIATIMGGDFSAWTGGGMPGDYNGNGMLDEGDLNELSDAVRAGAGDLKYDVNSDNVANNADQAAWVTDLKRSYIGDSNLDGEFNSADFVQVFQRGEYEDGIAANSQWADGDWNNDQEFDSSDFVAAFQAGGYEIGPRPPAAVAAVPEPAGALLLLVGTLLVAMRRRRLWG